MQLYKREKENIERKEWTKGERNAKQENREKQFSRKKKEENHKKERKENKYLVLEVEWGYII